MLSGLALSSGALSIKRFDFRFSQGALRADEIFDSALSGPGRYLLEIARRLIAQAPEADWLVLGNPILPLSSAQLEQMVVHGATRGPAVIADANRLPVAYLLPRRLFDELGRFLLLLCATDAKADAHLLSLLLGEEVGLGRSGLPDLGGIPGRAPNGWLNGDGRLLAPQLTCLKAAALIAKRPDWQSLPFAAHYPMHAGDVLFMCLASKLAATNYFSKQIVCTAYRDIPAAAGSKLETLPLRLPWISRDGSVSELAYFKHALERLGPEANDNHFFVFARILRLYFHTPFHLVDHARFALGDPLERFAQTVHAVPTTAEARCSLPPAPLRVLFHLNGGWALKNFPADQMRVVTKILLALGCEVSVVDRPDLEDCGARSVEAGDTALLRRQVEAHHIFVGVDSFPHHFVRLVMGWPTLGLFGNTMPRNSDALYGAGYRSADRNLSCNRCGAYDVCPMFNRRDCINYPEPQQVVAQVLDLAKGIYGFVP